jgi:hypothetical protein
MKLNDVGSIGLPDRVHMRAASWRGDPAIPNELEETALKA